MAYSHRFDLILIHFCYQDDFASPSILKRPTKRFSS
jgi:hypothetical protein